MRILVDLLIGCHCKSFIVKVLDSRLEVQPNDTLHWGVGGEVKHKNQDTVTVQAFYLSNPHKLMDIRQSGPLLKAAAHTGQCTPTHLHKSLEGLQFHPKLSLLSLQVRKKTFFDCLFMLSAMLS